MDESGCVSGKFSRTVLAHVCFNTIKCTTQSGASMEKAIGKEYVGKIGNAIAFDGGERMFGEGALHSGIYHSADCYVYFLDLIGKKIDNPVVELYKKRFPQNSIVAHPQRNTVLFKRSDSYVTEYHNNIHSPVLVYIISFDCISGGGAGVESTRVKYSQITIFYYLYYTSNNIITNTLMPNWRFYYFHFYKRFDINTRT